MIAELVAPDENGRPQFNDLLYHRRPACFYALDIVTMARRGHSSRTRGTAKAGTSGVEIDCAECVSVAVLPTAANCLSALSIFATALYD
jgi:hypothetical protein